MAIEYFEKNKSALKNIFSVTDFENLNIKINSFEFDDAQTILKIVDEDVSK